jgi:hypothetical protein
VELADFTRHGWSPVVAGQQATRAADIAREVARRCTQPDRISAALAATARQTAFPTSVGWEPYSLAQGDAGLALLCGAMDACFPEEGWDVAGHGFLRDAARAAERRKPMPLGMAGGLGGLGFAAWVLSRGGARYGRLLASIDSTLVPPARALAAWVGRQRGLAVAEFDAISGLAGIAGYLLLRRAHPPAGAALDEVVAALVSLTRPDGVPKWHTPAELTADPGLAVEYPAGNLNCGLAHGIPGPLAAMALALHAGVQTPGLAKAVEQTAAWLVQQRCEDEWGVNWPGVVPVPGGTDGHPKGYQPRPSRAAWCYGSPGVARSLWLAGVAVDDPALRRLAVEAMTAVYRRPVSQRGIDSPTFCHGVAGLLQITLRFLHDTGPAPFAAAAQVLLDQLMAAYEPDRLLAYATIEPGGNPVDQPGLLDGAPGVALVLLAAGTPVEPAWDRAFVLA